MELDVAAWPRGLGNAHLLLLHLPIGLMVAVVLVELWTWRDAAARPLVEKLLAINAVFAVLTAGAGLVLAAQGDYPANALGWHRWMGVGCAVTAVLAWWLRARRGLLAGRLGIGLLAVMTTVAGHLGATLTHGEDLLVWSAKPARSLVEARPVAAEASAGGLVKGTDVHPLLVKHCVECHGPEKQKGRLRLDTLAAAKEAGKSGERGVVPGDLAASEIVRRVELEREDEEAMPPGERTPLSADERAALRAWVAGLAAGE
jgi:mono/diheme cytochrome c family protein